MNGSKLRIESTNARDTNDDEHRKWGPRRDFVMSTVLITVISECLAPDVSIYSSPRNFVMKIKSD